MFDGWNYVIWPTIFLCVTVDVSSYQDLCSTISYLALFGMLQLGFRQRLLFPTVHLKFTLCVLPPISIPPQKYLFLKIARQYRTRERVIILRKWLWWWFLWNSVKKCKKLFVQFIQPEFVGWFVFSLFSWLSVRSEITHLNWPFFPVCVSSVRECERGDLCSLSFMLFLLMYFCSLLLYQCFQFLDAATDADPTVLCKKA